MKTSLSPKELALAVGVSESSLKRWADRGEIRVRRTAGGHRRIPLQEAVRFARDANLPIVRPDILNLPDLGRARQLDLTGDRLPDVLFERLKAGDAEDVRAVLLELYLAGHAPAAIFDGPMRQAMARLGELWQHSDAGIYIEHRATDICIQSVNLLRSLIAPAPAAPGGAQAEDDRPVALGGAPEDDPYVLTSIMVACVLAELGYREVNLGPDTPRDSLIAAARHYRPQLVWLSCSTGDTLPTPGALASLAHELADVGATLVLGGRAYDDPVAVDVPDVPGLHRFTTLTQLADFARPRAAAASSAPPPDSSPAR